MTVHPGIKNPQKHNISFLSEAVDNYLCLTTLNFDLSWVTFVHIFILWKTMYDLYNEISRKGRKRKVTMQIPRWILELKLITGWDCLCKLALSHVYLEQTILLYVQDLDLISCILRIPSIQCISYSGITIRKSSVTNLFYCVLRTTGTLHSSEYFLSSRFLDIAMQLIPKQVISRVNFNIIILVPEYNQSSMPLSLL